MCHSSTSLVQELVVIVGGEVGLSRRLAAERLTVAKLLPVVEAAGDTLVTVAVKSIEADAGATVYTGINLRAGQNRISVSVHNAGSGGRVGVDEVSVRVSLVIGAFRITVTQGRCECRHRRHGLAIALELGFALVIGGFNRCLYLCDRLGVGLRNDEADRELRRAAVDGLGLPD